ncbi:hypothetical protein Misp01_53710 [Microtetraspora sp. NBRC 13810]|nr:hypothetical protein Misp01_53710 [Microtetraspora sp. NBRC 13810]
MALAAALFAPATSAAATAVAADPAYEVLVFSKTAGFRHDSIPAGIDAIRALGSQNNFTVTATEDAAAFTTSNLARFRTVVFLSTTGDVLNATQQSALESYVNGGGGYVGVHAAADTEYDWPYYGRLVGAWFRSHPAIQQATIRNEDRAHPATAHLAPTWSRTDEWYNYRANPRATSHVLQNLDEGSYSGADMGDHPITWCHQMSAGRSFYTGLGHTASSYTEPAFRSLLLGGIRYAAGVAPADCRPETGYTALYNGSTTGWQQAGPGGFSNSAATLTSFGGMGLYWYNAEEFTNYSLKLDWRAAGDDNSGVFIGFPASSDPNSAVNNGYEVQIDATDSPDRTTGSVYGVKSADIAARDRALNPPGQWNTYELLVEGERLQVFLNGVKINDFTNTNPVRSLKGYIGLQNHGDGDDVAFRNVRIKKLGGGPGPQPGTPVEAESYTSQSGVQPASHAAASGGRTVGYIDNNDWVGYSSVNTAGATAFAARVSSGGAGGTIQVRSGSATGTVLGSVQVRNTGSFDTFANVSTTLSGNVSGPLFLTFTGTGSGGLFDVDTFTLTSTPTAAAPSTNVHAFYYPWYGSPARNGTWRHWQQGGQNPPEDVGADLYPTLGAYDSGDTAVLAQHMKWLKQAGAGVLVYSWWGRGSYEDNLTRGVMDAAAAEGIKVAWHIEPYTGRTGASVVADINYINQTYGGHPAFYRAADRGNRPAYYVFESLRITDWSALSQVNQNNIILAQTTDTSKIAGFSGMYTYDGIAGATAPGWKNAGDYAKANNLVWSPSVAPGYIDDRAVPGNTTPTLGRDNGAAYDRQWNNALNPATGGLPTWVSITSFNEWHEGSPIEPVDSTPPAGHGYQTYNGAYGKTGTAGETAYLDRTRYWATEFENRR